MRERLQRMLGPTGACDLDPHLPRRLRPHPAPRGGAARLPLARSRSTTRPTRYASSSIASRSSASDPKRFTPRGIHAQISNAKNPLVTPDEYLNRVGSFWDQTVAEVYELLPAHAASARTRSTSTTCSCSRCEVLERFPEAREKWQRAFRYVLVDEYQDTNHAQYRLLQLLADEARQRVRGGRSGPVDLPLPRRGHPQHPRLRARLPRRPGRSRWSRTTAPRTRSSSRPTR